MPPACEYEKLGKYSSAISCIDAFRRARDTVAAASPSAADRLLAAEIQAAAVERAMIVMADVPAHRPRSAIE